MKYLFIVNPISGKRDAKETIVPLIENWFKNKDFDWQIVLTEYPKHAEELARTAGESGEKTRVCACGGDGTLSETVNGAFGFDNLEIACFPCGSGNDFIKCFGGAENFRSVELVVNGFSTPIDVLRVNDCNCFNLMSVGIDADVTEGTIRWRRFPAFRGAISYNLALAECLLKPLGKKLRMTVDGERFDGTYMLTAAGNGKVYGGGYVATPEARPDDGIIDVVTVDKIPLMRIMKVLGLYKRGEHIVDGKVIDSLKDCVHYMRASELSIESDKEFVVNIDGEVFMSNSITVKLLHHAVRFVVPAEFVK
ncbi:MAG: diacylglycerol kinase family lipid kinase [Oscillospiraceae bacterium]